MMCQRIGFPPISTMGLGFRSVSSEIRVPKPPARMTACMSFLQCIIRLLPRRQAVGAFGAERTHASHDRSEESGESVEDVIQHVLRYARIHPYPEYGSHDRVRILEAADFPIPDAFEIGLPDDIPGEKQPCPDPLALE